MAIQRIDTLLALKAINLVSGLNANDRRVAAALLEHFNRGTGQCDPGLNRLSRLLGISTRTVIRSNHRLERAGLFKKTRHGGLSNRNSYKPNWARFQEIETAWRTRFNAGHSASVPEASPTSCQPCHLESDGAVTQTCITNLPKATYEKSPPKEEKERGTEFRSREKASATGTSSRDAAETAAERRWNDALHVQFGSMPVTYGEILQLIDGEMQIAATAAEMRCHGAGVKYILNRLRIPRSGSPASSEL
jgi:hypothetical protein